MRKDRGPEPGVGRSPRRGVGDRGNLKGEETLSATYCCIEVLYVTVAAQYNKSACRIWNFDCADWFWNCLVTWYIPCHNFLNIELLVTPKLIFIHPVANHPYFLDFVCFESLRVLSDHLRGRGWRWGLTQGPLPAPNPKWERGEWGQLAYALPNRKRS